MKLTIIDTKAGNFSSIINGFKKIGCEIDLTQDKDSIKKAQALVIPGVSSFYRGMKGLNDANLINLVKSQIINIKVPTIGICLGMQLLAKTSTEGSKGSNKIDGLGILDANIIRLLPKTSDYRVPNIGWYDVYPEKESISFPKKRAIENFYHVHSYHMICNDPKDVAGTINYGDEKIVVSIEKDNIFGCQFHPEKSQDAGLDLLNRFVKKIKSA